MEFSPATEAWFTGAFAAPTEAQRRGWDAIERGDHTLILAPTGSGKTLAAFLWAIDRLVTSPPASGCRVLYVSPLKALTYDVARNLQTPLAGISREASRLGRAVPDIRVATRTGDTAAQERRRMSRQPPDILVTTPESLYLMLTSSAAEMLVTVEHVIVDEIHAVASTKRGSHLALSLERLEEITLRPPQRIGLSATQRPLEEVARFLGGGHPHPRPVTVVDAGTAKPLELSIVVPADPGETPPAGGASPAVPGGASPAVPGGALRAVPGGERPLGPANGSSAWPAIYPALLELIRAHRSTLIFVNSRRLAERLAARLNELAAGDAAYARSGSAMMGTGAPADLVRAHHGSVARQQRQEIEEALKAGTLAALVATSSLELGIDMSSIDLVVQVEAPTSVTSGLQRVGRSGHSVGEPSRGCIFPKFGHDLLVSAAVAERMGQGLVEQTRIPRNPLDVLAQQLVATVAAAGEKVEVQRLFDMARRAYPYSDLPESALHAVLDMLCGRYPSDEYADLRPRLIWDRVEGTLEARPGAKMLAVISGGTIPDRGLYGIHTPDGARVGELDEEMVHESRPGDTFLLGATTWRIQEITQDRVIAVAAPGVPGKMPFWHGDAAGRPFELGEAIGVFTRTLGERGDDSLAASCGLGVPAVATLRHYVGEEVAATGGALASDRHIVVERFRDELGDWRVAVLSPFGAKVHAPWALAIEAKIRRSSGVDVQTVWSDDGIILRRADSGDAPPTESILIEADEVEDLVVSALGPSALFASRFRENAARSLLLPRRRPGRRTPLWQLRRKSADLLAVASRHASFPVMLETYRECLRDVFDLPALVSLLEAIKAGKVQITDLELDGPSPFARGLVFAYVAQFMYDGDAPLAERRAQALTVDRRMLADLLGTDELRDLLDAGVLAELEASLQGFTRPPTDAEAVADLLRRLGDLSVAELAERGADPALAADLIRSHRAVVASVAGEQRLILLDDAARYRDGAGAVLPPDLVGAPVEPVPDARVQLVRRWARTHGPFAAAQPAARFGLGEADVTAVLADLAGHGRVVAGGFRPGGQGRDEWCDTEVLRVLRRRSLAALRREVEPAEAEALIRFLPVWHGVAPVGGAAAPGGIERVREVVSQLEGFALPASVLEADVLAARVRDYSPRWLDELMVGGEVMWVGAGRLGRGDGRVVLVRRERAGLLLPRLGLRPGPDSPRPEGAIFDHVRQQLTRRGACFFRELGRVEWSDQELLGALWDLVWAGEVTSDGMGALRASVGAAGRDGTGRGRGPLPRARRPRPGSLHLAPPPAAQGRWSLVANEIGFDPQPSGNEAGRRDAQAAAAVAGALVERHGVLTRDAVKGEAVPGGFASIYPVLEALEESGRLRRGYFVAGLGGAQFALPGAVERLRHADRHPIGDGPVVHLLAATDPANAFGLTLPWPVRGPSRTAGAFVVLVDGSAAAYLERGGSAVVALREADGTWESAVAAALADAVAKGRWRRLRLQRYPEEMVSALGGAGFIPSPKGLVRYS